MASSLASLELAAKPAYALANGVLKQTFQNDDTITSELIKEHVFPESKTSKEEVAQVMKDTADVFRLAASKAWGVSELQDYLTSTLNISNDDVIAGFVKAWKADAENAHNTVVSGTVWNSQYKGISWRVDLLSSSKAANPEGDAPSEPVALVQLRTTTPKSTQESVLVEMSSDDVARVVEQLDRIQAKLDVHG